ncbi:MAG: ClpP family protease [Butyricicoccus sp.]|jgi:ATP-dependent protease ClpP protease subunit|nr:ATP-dependent Clp protease proteolytic subunit [Clostridiales bacterium]
MSDESKSSHSTDFGSVTTQSSYGVIHCITIIGTIEGHQEAPENTKTTKYEHVLPQLAAIEESEEIDGLLILLNTVGGDVEAGLAIAELIAGMKTPTVSLILGGSHSIGVPLAVAARRTFIAPSASMMLHPVRISGTVIGAPQTYEYFRQIQKRITRFIVRNSSVKEEALSDLMMATGELASDVGTVIGAKQAVKIGLCDEVGTLHDALSCLHAMIKKR